MYRAVVATWCWRREAVAVYGDRHCLGKREDRELEAVPAATALTRKPCHGGQKKEEERRMIMMNFCTCHLHL
jgi:hypothetical protein